jgi:rRNA maturation endonuclease Nob1
MPETYADNLGRRDFLKNAGAMALVGAACLGTGLRQALAQAKQAGKPLLTEKGVNEFINSKTKAELRSLMQEASKDLIGFLHKHFFLAAQQESELKTLSKTDISKLSSALTKAEKQNMSVKVKIITGKVAPTAHHSPDIQNGSLHISVSFFGHEILNITVEKAPAKAN